MLAVPALMPYKTPFVAFIEATDDGVTDHVPPAVVLLMVSLRCAHMEVYLGVSAPALMDTTTVVG